ncbi:MAG: cytochrome P450 [Myxococcales bacterium]|nr:cytochrome P450 [Myxococcales bacterium]
MEVDCNFAGNEGWGPEIDERLAWLRENEPIYWSEQSRMWIVTRYEDVEYVSKNQPLFTSGEGVRPGVPKIGLIDEAEPRHGKLRQLINRGFTPRMVQKLEGPFREIVTETIDLIAPLGECDFVSQVAVPIPLLLIAEMIGIEKADRDKFHQWSDSMMAAAGVDSTPEVTQRAGAAFMEYATYVTKVIEDRRANPRDDLVTILAGAKDEGMLTRFDARGGKRDRADWDARSDKELEIANDEITMLLVILLVAGNETTRNGISGGMELLIRHPEERKRLVEDPSLIPTAVEEMVRLVSPVRSFSRTVTEDTELGGKKLSKGDVVLLAYPSANTDPERYEDPERFDIERGAAHLGFGVGTHFCLGANLARMEMRVAFEELLRRLPDMEFSDGGPVLRPSPLVRTCAQMRVRYTPERSVA